MMRDTVLSEQTTERGPDGAAFLRIPADVGGVESNNGKKEESAGKKEKNKRRRQKKRGPGKKPDPFLARPVQAFLYFWFRRFRPRYEKSGLEGLKPPYILLVNHPSCIDAFILGNGMDPLQMNVVASAYFYRFPVLRFLLNRIGAIPKAHGQKDLQALRMMKTTLQEGRILVVFPEGRRTIEGRGSRFPEAMAKFAKKCGVPVAVALIEGTFHAWPRWAEHARPGPVSVTFRRVLTTEQLEALPVGDIHQVMLDALRFDEHAANRKNGFRYRCRRPADQIERLLHLCPDCGCENAVTGEGSRVRCRFCGAEAELDACGMFRRVRGKQVPWPDVSAWYDLQRAGMAERMREPGYTVEVPAVLRRMQDAPRSGMRFHARGVAVLRHDGLSFSGKGKAGPCSMHFPMRMLDNLPLALGRFLEICDDGDTYWQFEPEGASSVVRMEQYSDICLSGEAPPFR